MHYIGRNYYCSNLKRRLTLPVSCKMVRIINVLFKNINDMNNRKQRCFSCSAATEKSLFNTAQTFYSSELSDPKIFSFIPLQSWQDKLKQNLSQIQSKKLKRKLLFQPWPEFSVHYSNNFYVHGLTLSYSG